MQIWSSGHITYSNQSIYEQWSVELLGNATKRVDDVMYFFPSERTPVHFKEKIHKFL